MQRRPILRSLLGGSLVFPGLVSELLAGRPPQHAAKAKRVIFLYLTGGMSHLDTFDPKPELNRRAGELIGKRKILGCPYKFQPHGQSGTEISDLFPHLSTCADDLCLIRSLHGDHGNHAQAVLSMHTGSGTLVRPSIGSWISYGLGSANHNLPTFVTIAPHLPYSGALPWGSAFLPRKNSGVRIVPGKEPVKYLGDPAPPSQLRALQRRLLADSNRSHLAARASDPRLESRIASLETAYGMQMEMPEALDLTRETDATHRLYGLERGSTRGYAWQCLVARRLAERGVRFIELVDTGASYNWDAHTDIRHQDGHARNVDQPIAGLLKDLKSRGMLEDTLIVCTTEFGRTPTVDPINGDKGRGHLASAFSSWLAGAGVNAGTVYGKTNDLGTKVVENPVHVHDFHATILHLLGFDHEALTYRHAGRDFRLTDVSGDIVKGILS